MNRDCYAQVHTSDASVGRRSLIVRSVTNPHSVFCPKPANRSPMGLRRHLLTPSATLRPPDRSSLTSVDDVGACLGAKIRLALSQPGPIGPVNSHAQLLATPLLLVVGSSLSRTARKCFLSGHPRHTGTLATNPIHSAGGTDPRTLTRR